MSPKPAKSPYAPPSPPPLICPICAEHQIHTPSDKDRLSWFCPHSGGGTWALWNPTKRAWRIVQGLPQAAHRRIMRQLEEQALAMSAGWFAPDGTELPVSPAETDQAAGDETELTP